MAGVAVASVPLVAPSLARAAWSPSQPIHVLVGYPPGGAVDILVRVVGEAR